MKIPVLTTPFNSSMMHLEAALREAKDCIGLAGFKNLDAATPGIHANRAKIFVYFDYDGDYFPISLRFEYTVDKKLEFVSLDDGQSMNPITDYMEAMEKWNEWTANDKLKKAQ